MNFLIVSDVVQELVLTYQLSRQDTCSLVETLSPQVIISYGRENFG